MSKNCRICRNCIMDESVPDIRFDQNGECNFCKQFVDRMKKEVYCEKTKRHLNCCSTQHKVEVLGVTFDDCMGSVLGLAWQVAQVSQERI